LHRARRPVEIGAMRGRTIVILLGLVFIGTPLVLIALLVRAPAIDRVTVGAQPGGRVSGIVRDARGVPASGATIEALLARPLSGESRVEHDLDHLPELAKTACTTTVADEHGAFELALPPGDGFYVLEARTPTTLRTERWVSLLDGAPSEPLEFELRSGARLVVELTNAGAQPQGFYDLSIVIQGGLMRLKESLPATSRGAFHGASFVIESVPVCPMRLRLDLPNGVHVERELVLAFGENRVTFDFARR
jgi:hypothetical protein